MGQVFTPPPSRMPDAADPNQLHLVNDFFNPAHIPDVIDYLDAYGVVWISVEFTDAMVKEPFSISTQINSQGTTPEGNEKIAQIVGLFNEINKVIIMAVKEAEPIMHS